MIDVVLVVTRTALYGSMTLLVGGLFFLALVWPEGYSSERLSALLKKAWVVAFVAAVLTLLLQGPYLSGDPVTSLFDTTLLQNVLGTMFGKLAVIRIFVLLGIGGLLWFGLKRQVDDYPTCISIAVGCVILIATMSLSGHANNRGTLIVAFDMLHLVAASVWLGGLVILIAVVLPTQQAEELAISVPAFSVLAFSSVVVLAVTGAYHGLVQLGSIGALTANGYGQLLGIKMLGFAVLIGLGAISRNLTNKRFDSQVKAIPRARSGSSRVDTLFRRQMRQNVSIEVGVGVLVLLLTAALVMTNPPTHETAAAITDQVILS